LPNARILKATSSGSGSSASAAGFPFQTSVTPGDSTGSLQAVFSTGLIAGVKPRIGPGDSDKFIDDNTGPDGYPEYAFNISDVIDDSTGIGMLYWQLEFNPDFSIQKIYPVALDTPPDSADYKGWKLIGFLVNAVGDTTSFPTWNQMIYHNLNHVASQRAGGKARHTFWAVS
jgi:hypothetical protein